MQNYSKNLEILVAERTKDLIAEKQKTDRLLYSKYLFMDVFGNCLFIILISWNN